MKTLLLATKMGLNSRVSAPRVAGPSVRILDNGEEELF